MSNLESLVVDEMELDQQLLTNLLRKYLKISKKTGKPIFTPEFSKLSEASKIIVFLLGRKAGVALGLLAEGESCTPKAIAEGTGVNYGTVKPAVTRLASKGILVASDGSYIVPSHLLLRVEEFL